MLNVANPLGLILMVFASAFLLPAAWALAVGDAVLWAFVSGMFLSFLVGLLLWAGTRRFARALRPRDGFLLVALTWIAMALVGCVPLLLAIPGLSFTNAYFEAVAGVTATNASTLGGLDQLPAAVNLWRCELQWIGGLGGLGVAVAILPSLGIGTAQAYRSERVEAFRGTHVTRRFARTAGALWLVYIGLTGACLLALRVAGMSWFDALCHAFSTLSLGGFSSHDANIGYFHSPLIDSVVGFFVLVAAMNFATHLAVWRGRDLRAYLRDAETRALVVLIAASVVGVAVYLRFEGVFPTFLAALRDSAFDVVSMATGAGFTDRNYAQWPVFVGLWMLLLGCVTASAGSTGGGLKMARVLIFFKHSGRELRRLMHPNVVNTLKIGVQVVPEHAVSAVLGYVHLYLLCVVGLSLLLVLSGMGFVSAFSAIVSTLNNVGPGLGMVAPGAGYAGLGTFQTWVCAASMLLGHLEIVVLILPFTRVYWRE